MTVSLTRSVHDRQIVGELDTEGDLRFTSQPLVFVHQAVQPSAQRNRLDVDRRQAALESAEVECRVHQLEQHRAAPLDTLQRVPLRGAQRSELAFAQQIRVAEDDVQRRA